MTHYVLLDIIKNFTITNETADFYVVPGFIKTEDDFFLELTNLRDNKVEVEISAENYSDNEDDKDFFDSLFSAGTSEQKIELSSGDEGKKVNFEFDSDINESKFTTINLSSENTSYSVPVYMEFKENKKTEEKGEGKLTFEPQLVNVSLATNSNTTRIIYLQNTEDISVKNISLYVSESLEPYVSLSITKLDELDENSSTRIELYISSSEDEGNIEGQITAKYENESDDLSAYFPVSLNFIKDYVPKYEENITIINEKTCSELNGTICNVTTESCSGESVYANDNKCCLDECEAVEQSSTWEIIGWGLLVLVVLFVAWFLLKRYKRTSNPVDLMKVARGKR